MKITNPFSSERPNISRSGTITSSGQDYGKEWLDWQKDKIAAGAPTYEGRNPFLVDDTRGITAQKNTLGGLQREMPGRWNEAYGINKGVAGMTPATYEHIGDRSGGPAGGYFDPYRDQMKKYMQDDYVDALADMESQVGAGAYGANAFGGARHGVASGVGGAKAMDDYLRASTEMDSRAYENAMQWQLQDQNLQAQLAMQANQDRMQQGQLSLGATARMRDITPQLNLASQFGEVGEREFHKKMGARNWLQQNWKERQAREDQWMRDYMQGVQQTPWAKKSVQTGKGGKSNFDKTTDTLAKAAMTYGMYKMMAACIPKGTTIDMADGTKVPIEKIEAGDLVIGMDGREVEVQQIHQYKQTPLAKFVTVTFDNGSKVNCSHDHMINDKRARNYKIHDKIGSREVTKVVFYMGVKRSYDIITTTGGYRIEGIPVNTMIPEMAEKSLALANKIMKAA